MEVGTLLSRGQWMMLGVKVLLASSGWRPVHGTPQRMIHLQVSAVPRLGNPALGIYILLTLAGALAGAWVPEASIPDSATC